MSTYTTELRYILESYAGLVSSTEYPSIDKVIEKARAKLFDFNYPIFDEKYRSHLESLICLHYYRREIGFETVGLFKMYLERTMKEIMPYYNQLYNSQLLKFNPFYDVDLTRDHVNKHNGEETYKSDTSTKANGTNSDLSTNVDKIVDNSTEGTSSRDESESSAKNSANSSSNSENKQKYSDTPQGSIADLEKGKYLTNATINSAVVNDNSSATSSDKATTTRTSNIGKEQTTTRDSSTTTTGTTTNNTNTETSNNSNNTSIDDYLEHVKGKQGGASYASLLKEYRETFLNIDMEVIEKLNTLFMLVW